MEHFLNSKTASLWFTVCLLFIWRDIGERRKRVHDMIHGRQTDSEYYLPGKEKERGPRWHNQNLSEALGAVAR